MRTKFLSENLKGRYHLGNIFLDGRIILNDLKDIGYECVDWIHQVQDRDQWQTLSNAVVKLSIP
jgi:hypothetical protein